MFFLDYETFSEADLKKLGAYRYGEHPSTRIILCAITRDDGPVELYDERSKSNQKSLDLIRQLVESGEPVVCHNVGFEIAVSHYVFERTFGLPPPALEQWRCTGAMCRRAAIPWALKDAAKFLNLDDQKVDLGAVLIKHYSMPSAYKEPENGWHHFGEYCRQDTVVCREIYKRLRKSFSIDDEPGFFLDMRLNHRGIPVNLQSLAVAGGMVDMAEYDLAKEFEEITGVRPSQYHEVLGWLKASGYPAEDLQAATMEEILDQPPDGMTPEALRALQIRSGISYAALKKIPVMQNCACEDGRIRGAFLWSGAQRTHRWSGKLIQPQNFRRPTIKDTHLAYECLKNGMKINQLEDLFGPIPEVLASCIRHFIELDDHQFLDADYANIEARITPWLCGQEDMLDEFRSGEDVYTTTAAAIFGISPSRVTKEQRFIGKQTTLACQFQTGWRKFKSTCSKFGFEVSSEICQQAVKGYRAKRDKIVDSWALMNEAAMQAIRSTGKYFTACRCRFRYGLVGGFPALQMELPSGHKLTYPHARIKRVKKRFRIDDEDEEAKGKEEYIEIEKDEIQFWGRLKTTQNWCYQGTYGGKLLENATQAVGGDFLTHGMCAAEAGGYPCFATIHDQALCVMEPHHDVEEFRRLLCTSPAWATGFPLEASAAVIPFYTKD